MALKLNTHFSIYKMIHFAVGKQLICFIFVVNKNLLSCVLFNLTAIRDGASSYIMFFSPRVICYPADSNRATFIVVGMKLVTVTMLESTI